nr:unnamed protein product [Callosobruchus chinensis]
MSFAHLNCRSLFTGFDQISSLLSINSYDIFAVTETWLNEDVLSEAVAIDGYEFYRRDRAGRGGGVGFYVKNSLQCNILDFRMENAGNLEYLWLNVKFSGKKICFCVIYRPPRSKLQDCLQYLDSVLPKCLVEFDNIILLGDFNSNFLENDNKILECLSCYGFQQVIKEPTRVTAQACTLIDPIFVLSPYPLLSAGTLNADLISDHHLVFCKLTLLSLKTKAKLISFRDFNQFNQESFFHDLTGVNWDEIFYVNNIDSKVSLLTEKINQLFDLHAPYKQIRVNKPFAPWLTDSLKLILKQRDEALAKFRSDRNTSNWKSYQQLRNYALASIRREKAGYLEYLQQQNKPK